MHSWPGNVRELLDRIRHAAAMCENGVVNPADLDLEPPAGKTRPLTRWRKSGMRPNCMPSRRHCNGNITNG
ncbi:hypothetical protein ACU4GD_24920 [Cupriavidus basilensis]